jgi:hypothetical protein
VFVERVLGEVRLPPLPGGSPASCRPEHGRFDSRPEEYIDADDPQFAAKVNACWLRMATEFGLLDQEREFLIGVDYSQVFSEPESAWVRVRLLETWDLVDSEVTLLGAPYPPAPGRANRSRVCCRLSRRACTAQPHALGQRHREYHRDATGAAARVRTLAGCAYNPYTPAQDTASNRIERLVLVVLQVRALSVRTRSRRCCVRAMLRGD